MTVWADFLTRRDADRYVCVEMQFTSGTKYIANRPLEEDATYWQSKLESMSDLVREMNMIFGRPSVGDVKITVENTVDPETKESFFGNIFEGEYVDNSIVNIFLKFLDTDGTVYSQQVYAGYVGSYSQSGEIVTINIKSAVMKFIDKKPIIREVNKLRHPSAPTESIGLGIPMVLGGTITTNGAVKLIMIDATAAAEKLVAMGHDVNILETFSFISAIYRKRAGVFTTLTITTDYTFAIATDGDTPTANKYGEVRLTAAAGHTAGDEYYANVAGWIPAGPLNHPPYYIADILNNTAGKLDAWWNIGSGFVSLGNSVSAEAWGGYTPGIRTEFVGAIPVKHGEQEYIGDQLSLLADIARNMDCAVVVNTENQIEIVPYQYEPLADNYGDAFVHHNYFDGDIDPTIAPTTDFNSFEKVTRVSAFYEVSNALESGYERVATAVNTIAETNLGLEQRRVWDFNWVRGTFLTGTNLIHFLLRRHLKFLSSNARRLRFKTSGLNGIQTGSDLGDIVQVTLPRAYGNYTKRQSMVVKVATNLIDGKVELEVITLGDSVGQVEITSDTITESQTELAINDSMFIGATEILCNGNSFDFADAATTYYAEDFLRQGHHFATDSICAPSGKGYGNINYRTLLNFDLPAGTWAGRTIDAVTIKLVVRNQLDLLYAYHYGIDVPQSVVDDGLIKNPDEPDIFYRRRFAGFDIYEFYDTSLASFFGAATTYNSFVAIPGDYATALGSVTGRAAGKLGEIYIELNSDGITAFQNAVDSTGPPSGINTEVWLLMSDYAAGNFTDAIEFYKSGTNAPTAIISWHV